MDFVTESVLIAVGLDYVALESVMRFELVPQNRMRPVFNDVRYMEAEALAYMREQ